MRYIDKSIKYYADRLAAKTPTPGGGSVAATLGVLGCGLLSMVANFTLARKGFNGYKERAKRVLTASEKLRKKLLEMVDKDIEAYDRLSKAFKKHKNNPVRMAPVLKRAVGPPAKVCNYVYKAATLSLELTYVSSKPIVSDVSVAIYVLDAAFEAALINIKINLGYIRDKKYIIDKTQQYTSMHKDIKRLKAAILSKIKERMFS